MKNRGCPQRQHAGFVKGLEIHGADATFGAAAGEDPRAPALGNVASDLLI